MTSKLEAMNQPPPDLTGTENYAHYERKHQLADFTRTWRSQGVQPGDEAPDFELITTTGEHVQLSSLRGKPVLLHFGSITWLLTAGGVPPLKQLHALYGDRVQFLDIMVRQAHPGERRGAYRTLEQKLADARAFKQVEEIDWPVLADDVAGTVHRRYGGMSDPVYLIDATGQVAFYGMWIDGPRLRQAIEELLAQGGVGPPVAGGIDRRPHMASALVEGGRSVSRGGVRAVVDLALAFPPLALAVLLGFLTRPLFRPLVVRTTSVSLPVRLSAWGAVAIVVSAGLWKHRQKG